MSGGGGWSSGNPNYDEGRIVLAPPFLEERREASVGDTIIATTEKFARWEWGLDCPVIQLQFSSYDFVGYHVRTKRAVLRIF